MKENSPIPWRLILSCLLLFGFLAFVSSPTAVSAAPTIDGVIDAEYGTAVASDPADPPQGNANLDLGDLYLTHDDTYLYIAYTINADIGATNWGKYLMYIDTTNDTNGATFDAWGRNVIVNDPHKPEFSINSWVDAPTYDAGSVQFFAWNQGSGSWGGASTITAAAKAAGATSVIEWQVALADLGNPENIWVEVYSTGGGADPAQDTINDPADDWNAVNWGDQSDLDVSTPYSLAAAPPITVDGIIEAEYGDPLASDPVDPPQGNANLDLGDLYVTEDADNFYIAYTINADIGATNWGKYLLYIDTTNDTSGATFDAWGRNVVVNDPHKPEFSINNWVDGGVFDTSTVQFWSWNGAGWDLNGSVAEAALATGGTSVIEYRVSKASLGNPSTMWLEVYSTGGGADPAQDTINEPADDWNATNWADQSTLAVSTEYPAPITPPPSTECASGAAQDNNIFWADLGHNSRDTLYRTPGGAVEAGTAVSLRLRTACDDLTSAQVRLWDDRLNTQILANMTLVASDSQYDWWETAVPVSAASTIYWYRFIAKDGSSAAYYEDNATRDGGWGQTFGSSPDYGWQLTMYDPTFQTPDWVKNGIMYQIFPERFRDGNSANNTPAGSFHYDIAGGSIVRSDGTDWHTPLCDPRNAAECEGIYGQNFYGGDLQGIVDKLDYLQDLGVTVLYLNPIFESPSNHKYDTTDFGVIDDNFGDLALFQTLSTEAHNRGINIVLDGVFNHTSSDSVYFDRYNRYPAPDSACESETSTYRSWFYFQPAAVPGTGACAGDADYEAWFGFDSLPKLNSTNQDVRNLIWDGGVGSIARYWMQWADGWRLDVAGDVDPGVTNDPNNNYWEGFRDAVHATNPDAYIVGEEWNVATAWTLGQEWDATMNYQFGSAIMSFWRDTTFVDNDHNAGSSAGTLSPITPSQLDARLRNLEERYPEEAYLAMMNLLGSHDTNRALFMLDENTGANNDTLYDNPNYDWSDAIIRLKGVALLQMTLPGSPTIYYGDEVGLVGPVTWDGSTWQDDPYNRLPYPWLDETGTPFYTHLQSQASQNALFNYYQTLTSARLAHAALRTGSLETLLTDDTNNVYAFARLMADYSDAAVVMVNRNGAAQSVTVDVSGTIAVGTQFTDALNGGIYTVDGNGQITVPSVPGMSGAVLVLDGVMSALPAAVSDLAVTAVNPGEVSLGWSAAAGADSYDVYRSLVSGGGYAYVGNTSGNSFVDTAVENAVDYYYVVVSKNGTTLLQSAYSNEVSATPGYNLNNAWFNLQWPHSIVHTISTSTPTENIYGQLWIDGVTSQPGSTAGILAQVGFGADGSTPDNSWIWSAMSFNVDAGNNDEFVGNLLPDMLGTFDYVTRYSADGGATWFYADINGPGINGNPGDLQVEASADTTAPAAPTGTAVTGTSTSDISIGWNGNVEADLAGYEVYRENASAPGYSRIASVAAGTTSYTDTSVSTGETYNYNVVAYDTSFNRSAASNIVTATAEPRLVSVTFTIGVPAYTPGTVYIVGSINAFGPWNPGLVPMTQVNATTWTKTVDILDGTVLDFKFTRGTWESVEAWGNIVGLANRQITISYGNDGTQLVDLTATDWGSGPDDEKAVQLWRDPIVTSHTPANGAVDVSVNTAVSVSWSLPMNAGTAFVVSGATGTVAGTFSYNSGTKTTTFIPNANLAKGVTYTVSVTGQVSNGNVQQVPVVFSFTTLQPTPQEMIDALIAKIGQLVVDGDLLPQDADKLIKRLEQAKKFVDAGLDWVAVNQMNGYMKNVNRLVESGRLDSNLGAELAADGQAIIDRINE